MRVPPATAARMRSIATAMSPSRKGSCPGSSASRKRRALAGSAYPRRTSTDAVISLSPSSRASASAAAASYGSIDHTRVTVRRPPDGFPDEIGCGCALGAGPLLFGFAPTPAERIQHDLHPEEDEADGRSHDEDRDRRNVRHLLERVLRHRRSDEPDREHDGHHRHPEPPVVHVTKPRSWMSRDRRLRGASWPRGGAEIVASTISIRWRA